jgi:hypothetical protein
MKRDALNVEVMLSPDALISFKDWCTLARISKRVGQQLRAAGDAPRFVRISPKRIATTLGDHREWLATRAEADTDETDVAPSSKRKRQAAAG